MKKAKTSEKPKTDLEKILIFFEKKITELEHSQKVSSEKITVSLKDINLRVMTEASSTRQYLENTLRAEIQVAHDDLKTELKKEFNSKLEELEKNLNKRITTVGDLITKQLGTPLQDHEKRITKLEHTASAT